jgi:hypothetical protein
LEDRALLGFGWPLLLPLLLLVLVLVAGSA